jgi:hypothetical protein
MSVAAMVNWLRVGIGLALLGLGTTAFLGAPLPMGCRTPSSLAQLAISAGGLVAPAGVGVLMSGFQETRAR